MNPNSRRASLFSLPCLFACCAMALASPDVVTSAPGLIFAPPGQALDRKIAFVQPLDQSTVFNNSGNLEIQVRVGPAGLHPGDEIVLLLDDKPVARGLGTDYSLEGLERDMHHLRAQIIGPDGRTVVGSAQATFFMWRASSLFANRTGK